MRHLRSEARKLGLKIQTRRATGSEPVRYRVVDQATSEPIGTDLLSLDDVQARLTGIVREREQEQSGESPQPVAEVAQRCPSCGTPRMGFFRLCLTCGLDYEARVKPGASTFSSNGAGTATHPPAGPAAPAGPTPTEPSLAPEPRAPRDVVVIPGPGDDIVVDRARTVPELPPPMREIHDLPKGPNILVRFGYWLVDLVRTLGKVAGWAILIVIAVGLVTLFANSMR